MNHNRHPEYQYLDLLQDILDNGCEKKDHNTGISLYSVFGRQIRFDMSKWFPLLTTKKTFWKGILEELYWFLSGQTNIKYLVDRKVHIWDDYPHQIYMDSVKEWKEPELTIEEFREKIKTDDDFAQKWGDLPMIYGQQWRSWPTSDGDTIDQLAWVVKSLKEKPHRKSICLSVWNPEYLYDMGKPGKSLRFPLCHVFMQFAVHDGKLNLQLYQRSADMFLGVPFNIGSYSLLLLIVAQITGLEPGEFVHTFWDAHIYGDHIEQVKEQLSREPFPFPTLKIDDSVVDLDSFSPDKVTLENYESHGILRAKMTVAGWFNEKDRK